MSKKNVVRLWVDKDFARLLKTNASLNGMKIIDYTKCLNTGLINNIDSKNKQKKNEEKYKFSW